MEMKIHLDSDIFDIVENGTKTVEARVNDEKRRKLKPGDKIIFLRRPDEIDIIEAEVKELKYYSNFKEMVNYYNISELYDIMPSHNRLSIFYVIFFFPCPHRDRWAHSI